MAFRQQTTCRRRRESRQILCCDRTAERLQLQFDRHGDRREKPAVNHVLHQRKNERHRPENHRYGRDHHRRANQRHIRVQRGRCRGETSESCGRQHHRQPAHGTKRRRQQSERHHQPVGNRPTTTRRHTIHARQSHHDHRLGQTDQYRARLGNQRCARYHHKHIRPARPNTSTDPTFFNHADRRARQRQHTAFRSASHRRQRHRHHAQRSEHHAGRAQPSVQQHARRQLHRRRSTRRHGQRAEGQRSGPEQPNI